MVLRISRLFTAAIGLALGAVLVGPAVPPQPSTNPDTATFRALIERADSAAQSTIALGPGEWANLFVQLETMPLALGGPTLSAADRAAQAAQIAAAQDRLGHAVSATGGIVLGRLNTVAAGLAVRVDAAGLAALRARPDVLGILPIADYAVAQAEPGDTATLAQVGELIGSTQVNHQGTDGEGIDIAVVDSGIDYTHAKLGGPGSSAAYYRAYCGGALLRPGDPSCDPSLDPPLDLFPNQKVLGGYDYLGDIWPEPDERCPDSEVCIFPDANPIDGSGHGTHVADIAAGLPAAGSESGIAPGANLWAFKACNGAAALCEGSALLLALDHAMDLDGSDRGRCRSDLGELCAAYDPADVIVLAVSYSYGQPEDALTLFADLAGFYGSLVVAAAGNDGNKPYIIGTPAVASASLAVAESSFTAGGSPSEGLAPSASRGPRIADSALKPDIAAPGAISSAAVGTGVGLAPFGGSSGAAPVVAGTAALLIQELEQRGAIDSAPGLRDSTPGALSLAPLLKALLMNTADPLGDESGPIPASRAGSGRVSALNAFRSRTLAVDATEISAALASDPALSDCTISPYRDLVSYLFFKRLPPCARAYPGGNTLLKAWNAQSGSISFGYQAVTDTLELQRTVAVVNYSRSPRNYDLSIVTGTNDPGVELSVSPSRLSMAGTSIEVVTVTLRLDSVALREWSAADGAPYEVQGALIIDGGPSNRLTLPWHVMPHRAAAVTVARPGESRVMLRNSAAAQEGVGEVFALVDMSTNQCDLRDDSGVIATSCTSVDYRPGDRPGSRESPPDIAYVGVRGRSVPGLNASYGLPPAPAGATPDELIEFAVSVYDLPYRASPLTPVRFEVAIDANRDGVTDYLATSDEQGTVLVRDVNPADGTLPERSFGLIDADYHTQWWILPVPAAAVDLRSDQPFSFIVRAYDTRFGGQAWDCSPGPVAACGGAALTFQTGAPAFSAVERFSVPAGDRYTLSWDEDPAGGLSSPSQLGLLLLLRDATPSQGVIPLRVR